MQPTNKLVSDLVAMEACYINTGHPDFLNGHRVGFSFLGFPDIGISGLTNSPGVKAMAIVNEKHNAAKPVQVDPKTGKPLPARTESPNPQSLDTEENKSFFGSFWASKNKKKMAAMEAPPPQLKASGVLSEREGMEVEVISKLKISLLKCFGSTVLIT